MNTNIRQGIYNVKRLNFRVSVLNICDTSLILRVLVLYLRVSALHLRVSVLNICISALILPVSALHLRVSAIRLRVSALHLRVSVLDICVSALHLPVSAQNLHVVLLRDSVAQFYQDISLPVPLQAMFMYGVRPAISERHIKLCYPFLLNTRIHSPKLRGFILA